MSKTKTVRPRRVPERTCIACRRGDAKRQLVRLVRNVSGGVEIDLTGKKPGRGAYLCRDQACWLTALKRRSIEHSLKTTLTADDRAGIESFVATLTQAPAQSPEGKDGDVASAPVSEPG